MSSPAASRCRASRPCAAGWRGSPRTTCRSSSSSRLRQRTSGRGDPARCSRGQAVEAAVQHDVAAEGTETRGCGTTRPLWRRWQTWAVLAAVTLAGFLLYRTLSRYSMEELVASVAAVPMARLLGAAGFAAASYLCLTGFDFLALRYVGRPLPYPRVALASFISLSIGHNIGVAFLSSGAVRYRFYSRWGLGAADIAKVILFCGVTVGLGLATLGGI